MNWDVYQIVLVSNLEKAGVDSTQTGPNPVVTPVLIRHLFAFGFEPVPKLLRSELGPWQRYSSSLIQQAGTTATEGIHKF
jgi:hypothetical protein